MKKRTIALNLRSFNYGELSKFAQGIHDGVQKFPALFPSPMPSLAVFKTSITTLSKAVAAWGKRGSHGGAKEKMALKVALEALSENLRSYARYVMAAQPDNEQAWLDAGFTLKALPTKTGVMEKVQNLHQFIARNIPKGMLKLKWQRPLGTPQSTVLAYKIFRSEDNDFKNAALIDVVMNRAVYMDTPPKQGILYYYWVIPVSTVGEGVLSEHCAAFASPV